MGDYTKPTIPDAASVVFGADEVDAAYRRMALALMERLPETGVVVIGVAVGGLFPLARLTPLLPLDLQIDFCQVSRYGEALTGGDLHWICRPRARLSDQHILIVDDICDEGETLRAVCAEVRRQGAADVSSAVLLRKTLAPDVQVFEPDVVGLEVDNRYVFGCGMDLRGHWRHLESIYALDSSETS